MIIGVLVMGFYIFLEIKSFIYQNNHNTYYNYFTYIQKNEMLCLFI